MTTRKIASLHKNQQGLVSITVTLIFILVISIITTSFAFLMRREQRQALDRQLSTQAFYAAESGVNDAVAALNSGQSANLANCDNPTPLTGLSSSLSADNNFQYTCLLVNETPDSLSYGDVGINESTVLRLKSASGRIGSIRISWQGKGEDPTIFATNANHDLPTSDLLNRDPNNFAKHSSILRTTIIPLPNSGNITRDTHLINGAQTLFLYPKAGATAGSVDYHGSTSNQNTEGIFVDGGCNQNNTPRYCSATIKGLGHNEVYLRLLSIYNASSVEIEAFGTGDNSNQKLSLEGAQYVIDATGRASDVLRRIQVRLPQRAQYYYPEFALESAEDICKRMLVFANRVEVDTSASGMKACRLNTNDAD